MYYVVRCDPLAGKEEQLDRLVTERKDFWLSQPGVKGFHVYADALIGYPERTIMVEVEDMATLERIFLLTGAEAAAEQVPGLRHEHSESNCGEDRLRLGAVAAFHCS